MVSENRAKQGIIFDIQRASIHDGPGIRTLVFFKGCPLKCIWCFNPESQLKEPELMYLEQKCLLCAKCANICPQQAIKFSKDNVIFIDRELCNLCGLCVESCLNSALKIAGKVFSVGEVMEIICRDISFYRVSGGGITLGGGEPLAQQEFAYSLLQEANSKNINTALETCGYAEWDKLLEILQLTDYLMIDLKLLNPEEHKKVTGKENKLLLNNIVKSADYMLKNKKQMKIRIPLIPTINDSKAHLQDIADFLKENIQVDKILVEVLPYHTLGVQKYKQLSRKYSLNGLKPCKNEEKEKAEKLLMFYGLNVK